MGIFDSFYSLAKDVNKAPGTSTETDEGVISDLLPELKLSMSNEELEILTKRWEKTWNESPLKSAWETQCTENENYWKGAQFGDETDSRSLQDNLIFEAIETFLPVATRQNPEPLVQADGTEAGNELADTVRKFLIFHGDRLRMKLKIKKSVRFWTLYHLGVMKVGWSDVEDDITLVPLRPQKLILDPKGIIEEGIYKGKYLGEHKKDSVETLIKRFPSKAKKIRDLLGEKDSDATELGYIEWWTDEYTCWTLKGVGVLDKIKNPHWNYNTVEKRTIIDEFGEEKETEVNVFGNNHFPSARIPYILLSIFNLGTQPIDETGLIAQNLSKQDLINKRLRQIDRNADSMNGGMAVSGDHFTEAQSEQVSRAVRKGGTIWVPTGDVNRAITKLAGQALPGDVFNQLADTRNAVRDSFGVRGSTPQGIINEQTVRGKILIRGQDESRTGLVTEYLEQYADQIYNWLVQLMYVYYDEEHTASVVGKDRATEYIKLKNDQFTTRLTVSVKEGSLVPKDPLTSRNEAIELWNAGALDPITLFERLEDPNPRETAKQLLLYKTNPMALFPELAQQMQPQGPEQPQQALTEQQPTNDIEDAAQQAPDINQIPIQ